MYSCKGRADGLKEDLKQHLRLLKDELFAFLEHHAELLRVMSSLVPFPMEHHSSRCTHHLSQQVVQT